MIPGVGPVLKPVVGGVENFLLGANNSVRPSSNRRGRRAAPAPPSIASKGRMGAAISTESRSYFRTWSTGDEMHVAGCDLVRPVPQNVTSKTDLGELFSVIPANPAYWTGTRVAQLAPGYQQYRPLAFTWEYIPQVAVTQPGTVTMGTLWDTSVNNNDLQQTLVTSNGGLIT